MPEHFSFQTYAWSLGTTSFRMADFHRKVEEQLIILAEFWGMDENTNALWETNTQVRYYEYAYSKGFITGELAENDNESKAKTARQKTSGLVDIGLLNDDRRLTEVGRRLLQLACQGDFTSDNGFQIAADSYIYLKQMLKTSYPVQDGFVRPFLVTGKLIKACDGYLSDDEFTYLLPLCVDEAIFDDMVDNIHMLRAGRTNIDRIICDTVLNRYNYPAAVDYLVHSDKTAQDIMISGMNRKSPRYDAAYAPLFVALRNIYLDNDRDSVNTLLRAAKGIKNKPGTLWRGMLFENPRRVCDFRDLRTNEFIEVHDENQLARRFFKYMHLFKIKANLSDYQDLNRRYLNITDAFIFDEGKVKFTPMFDNFFSTNAQRCFEHAFEECNLLTQDCDMEQIDANLVFDEEEVINVFNENRDTQFQTMEEVYDYIETEQYNRFRNLIDTRFPNATIISVLADCESREHDEELINMFGGEADVPTIFEYIVAVAWYRISRYQGKILEYMNLSLDMNLLPRTHAGGGESDIVYKYTATDKYPAHTLLIECTLMTGTTQRHGEMEPVSRHLANYMIDEDENAYCAFVANNLHASVISDFRSRKYCPYYRNDTEHVDGMKILPLHTRELRTVLEKGIDYGQIYSIFDSAYADVTVAAPPEWYNTCVKAEIDVL